MAHAVLIIGVNMEVPASNSHIEGANNVVFFI